MAELFKDHLTFEKLMVLSQVISQQALESNIDFDLQVFSQQLSTCCKAEGEEDWEYLSLMQRLRAGAEALNHAMPDTRGGRVIVKAFYDNKDLSGWLSLVCCEYIATHKGLLLDQGLSYLQQMTEYFSAEFAIRHFILREPKKTLAILKTWINHNNHHVRRLVSEGTRPRLPWGVRLPLFIEQPSLVLPLLFMLRDDSEEYVRRSVANHLNDLAKDHPMLVVQTAQDWLSDDSFKRLSVESKNNRIKLIRHACRTLFKQANPEALRLFGYGGVEGIQCGITLHNIMVPWGGDLVFDLDVTCENIDGEEVPNNKYMIDYVMYYQKANGKLAPKVFKWLDRKSVITNGNAFSKKHSFKAISTRKYYPGLHRIEIIMNGIIKVEAEFELLPEK